MRRTVATALAALLAPTAAFELAGAPFTASAHMRSMTPVMGFWDADTVTLTPQQVAAFGGDREVRPLTARMAAAEVETTGFWDADSVTLTSQQVAAFGGPETRPLNPTDEVTAGADPITSWYDAGKRLTWPVIGGTTGFHRMAGRSLTAEATAEVTKGVVVPTASAKSILGANWWTGPSSLRKDTVKKEPVAAAPAQSLLAADWWKGPWSSGLGKK